MIRSVRTLLTIWLVLLAAVGIVVGTNRAQKAYQCIVTLDEGDNPPEYFDIQSQHVRTSWYAYPQRIIMAGTSNYLLLLDSDDSVRKTLNVYWVSSTNRQEKRVLEGIADFPYYGTVSTDQFVAVSWRKAQEPTNDNSNIVSVFDAKGNLLQQNVLPITGALVQSFNDFFVYENAKFYYFVMMPDLATYSIPKEHNGGGGLSTRSPQRDKVGILTGKMMLTLSWIRTGQTIEWQFPRTDMIYADRSLLWSPDGRYLVVEFDDRNALTPNPKSLIYLFDTLNETNFTQHAEPLLDVTGFVSKPPIDWEKAKLTSDGAVFYYAPYWSAQVETTGIYDSNSAVRPLESPYWALVQYDPRTHQRRVFVQDILEYPSHFYGLSGSNEFRIIKYRSGTNITWLWLGADPSQKRVLYAGSGEWAWAEHPYRKEQNLAIFAWEVPQERSKDIIVVFNVLTGNHNTLPIGTLRDSVVKANDNRSVFYIQQVGGGFAAERLNLATGQTERLTDTKPIIEMQTHPNNAVLVFWEDANGKRQAEYYHADGKRLGTFPVTGNIVGMVGRVSSDGKLGLFHSADTTQALLELSPEGGSASKVLRALVGGKLSRIGWSPDGRAFSFAQVDAQNNHSLMIFSREEQQISQWDIAFWPDGSAATYEWSTCDVPHRFGDTAQN